MRRVTFRLGIGLLLAAALAAGCASFDSVKQTAALGVQLSTRENALDAAPALCRVETINPLPYQKCDEFAQDVKNWHLVNRSLVAYAKALSAMADDSKDKTYKDDISGMLGAAGKVPDWSPDIGKNVASGVSQGVDALVQTITGIYRRDQLKLTIEGNDDHIQAIATGFDKAIGILDKYEDRIQQNMMSTQAQLGPVGSPMQERAMKIGVRNFWMVVGAHRLEMADYKKAVDAFAKAHHDLKEGIGKIGDRKGDLEVIQGIAKDVSGIFQGINTALTPPLSN